MIKGADIATAAARRYVVGRLRGELNTAAGDAALVASLVAGPTGGRVHSWPLPDDYPLPAIMFSRYGAGSDIGPIGAGTPSVLATVQFQVRAVCEGYDDTPVIEPAAIINQLLDGKYGAVDLLPDLGTYNVEAQRVSELLTDLPVEADGTPYQHMGGIYSFLVMRVA